MTDKRDILERAIDAIQAEELESRVTTPDPGASLVLTIAKAMMIGQQKGLHTAAHIIAELRKENHE